MIRPARQNRGNCRTEQVLLQCTTGCCSWQSRLSCLRCFETLRKVVAVLHSLRGLRRLLVGVYRALCSTAHSSTMGKKYNSIIDSTIVRWYYRLYYCRKNTVPARGSISLLVFVLGVGIPVYGEAYTNPCTLSSCSLIHILFPHSFHTVSLLDITFLMRILLITLYGKHRKITREVLMWGYCHTTQNRPKAACSFSATCVLKSVYQKHIRGNGTDAYGSTTDICQLHIRNKRTCVLHHSF
jgi:hypothetical protein